MSTDEYYAALSRDAATTSNPLAAAIQLTVGAASMCWEHVDRAGVFDVSRALDVSDALLKWIEENHK